MEVNLLGEHTHFHTHAHLCFHPTSENNCVCVCSGRPSGFQGSNPPLAPPQLPPAPSKWANDGRRTGGPVECLFQEMWKEGKLKLKFLLGLPQRLINHQPSLTCHLITGNQRPLALCFPFYSLFRSLQMCHFLVHHGWEKSQDRGKMAAKRVSNDPHDENTGTGRTGGLSVPTLVKWSNDYQQN